MVFNKHYPPVCRCQVCECCRGPMFGPGLRIIRPVSKIYGIKNLPFLFRSCSSYCRHLFLSSTDTLAEILYGSEDGFQAIEAPWTLMGENINFYSDWESIITLCKQRILCTLLERSLLYSKIQWWTCRDGAIRSISDKITVVCDAFTKCQNGADVLENW